jgi:hypothetical protein
LTRVTPTPKALGDEQLMQPRGGQLPFASAPLSRFGFPSGARS